MVLSRTIGQGASGSLSDPVAFLEGRSAELSGQGGTGLQGGSDSFVFTSIKAIETLQAEIFTVEVLISKESLLQDSVSFGLMVRDNLDASSRHFSAMFSKDNGAHTVSRGNTYRIAGSSADSITSPSDIKIRSGTDIWLRIDRSGNEFRAYIKMDDSDSDYKRIGSAINVMTNTAEIGMVLASPQTQATVAFSSFSLSFGASTFQLVAQSGLRSITSCLQASSYVSSLYTSSCHASSLYQTFR